MATLACSFLEDLEGLDEEDENEINADAENFINDEDEDDTILDAIDLYEKNQSEAAVVVSDMTRRPDFVALIQKVRELSDKTLSTEETITEDDEEYQLIETCNEFVISVDKEILNIHKFIRDIYSKKFPELESIVFSPLEYIAIVQRVKNKPDLTKIDLSDLLPNTVIMAVTVAASMTTGAPLPANELDKVLGAAEEAMQLADCRKSILLYLESRMSSLAPNLTAILGSALAARLITHAGGLLNLARMPAQNIMLVGSSKKASLGYGTATAGVARGIINQCEIIQNTHVAYKNRAMKLVAGKCSLASRVDSFHQSPNGQIGIKLREQIIHSLLKSQEPPPAPQKKVLPLPDERGKTKRGGKRYRRMKEKYGLSDYRKAANRLKFGTEGEETYGLEIGDGFGMIGVSGAGYGKLKLQIKQQKIQLPKRRMITSGPGGGPNKKANLVPKGSSLGGNAGTAGSVSGTATALGGMSSLTFTPVQGLELCNPENNKMVSSKLQISQNKDKYFNSLIKFTKVEEEKAQYSKS